MPRPRPPLPLWAAVLTAAVGGIALDAAFPDIGVWPLVFVGVAFALVSLMGRSVGGALLVGAVFGAAFWFVHVSWATRYLGVVPWLALAGVETVFWAVGSVPIALAYRWLPRILPGRWAQLTALPALVAGLWTMRELWTGSWPYTGFPWGRIGMSLSESPLAGIASWTGVAGLTFLVVAFTAAVVEWLRAARFRDVRTALPAAALGVLLVALPAFPTTPAGTLRVGSVQGNGPSGYFDPRGPGDLVNAQLAATAPLMGEELDLLVWPEGGVDSDPLQTRGTARTLDALSERIGAPLLINAATGRGPDVFNTSMLWTAEDGPGQLHDKTHPVPFGEWVPDRWFFEMIVPDLVGLIGREYTPGTNPPVLDLDGVPIGLAICFDVIYDDVIWEGARDGAQLYVFQTNNADFRDTDENLQQLAAARMRAIETGRSVVNISTVGTSQVIAPDGAVIDALPAGEAGAMLTDVPLREGLTPASVVGPAVQVILGWGSLLAILVLGALAFWRERRARS
ncbi:MULTISPECIES: apolipoprotein N-acyltransferase [Microbacterium]|uniref:Apolipoprotein N-acyltransferase n=1 Tax=Microbacterium wangchenii TaxID=2541726 RepID=A0ABX5SU29_9MICO|nr:MULTISPECIES: apolipoprotein N-acyltransferase [Microbacterium]MCK6065205.1 apolipoprotein N-acyltransferase [Microbacterium sp. EYE_512]QBR88657.1 apolipoprotein N-acyltransferase [Microbacterium wangchenii]TXK20381.1 apolipoprotein N-acyltransferase [Microbacterium wangchenii]